MANSMAYKDALLAALGKSKPLYKDFTGGANNSIASAVGAPVDLVNRYMGNQPNAVMGSDWIRTKMNSLGIGTQGQGIAGIGGGLLGSMALPGSGLLNAIDTSAQIAQAKTPGQMMLAAGGGLLGPAVGALSKPKVMQEMTAYLEAAPTPSVLERRMKERFGEFAQAHNLGLPDTPEYRRIVKEVTTQGPLSDDALSEAIRLHPAYLQAGGKHLSTELIKSGRVGASALVDSLSRQGIKTRVETSKSLGSRSTYIYASKGDKTVKIRLSDHPPAESGSVYGANDIMTTPQHWKSAEKRAIKILERNGKE